MGVLTKIVENEQKDAELIQLRAELERLKKEAHDKHWPLANACRNLLPHSDEDNVTQVWAASRKIEQLHAEVERLENLKYMGINAEYVETIKRLRAEVKSLTKRLEMVTYGDMITHKQGCPCVQCTQTKYG